MDKSDVVTKKDLNTRFYRPFLLESIFPDNKGRDLAMARVSLSPTIGFTVSSEHAALGTDVWTFGYPFTDSKVIDGRKTFVLNARYLQGYITRDFYHEYGEYGLTPSYELSIPAPGGLSGAPIVKIGTRQIVGVVYGNIDVETVVHFGHHNLESGLISPDIQRIVSFGLAHYNGTLLEMATPLSDDQPLGEYLKGRN